MTVDGTDLVRNMEGRRESVQVSTERRDGLMTLLNSLKPFCLLGVATGVRALR